MSWNRGLVRGYIAAERYQYTSYPPCLPSFGTCAACLARTGTRATTRWGLLRLFALGFGARSRSSLSFGDGILCLYLCINVDFRRYLLRTLPHLRAIGGPSLCAIAFCIVSINERPLGTRRGSGRHRISGLCSRFCAQSCSQHSREGLR